MYIGLAAIDTDRLTRSPVLANREWAWMVMTKGARWCIRQATMGINAGQRVQSSLLRTPMMTLYRAN
jgi:hypothetical protein